IGLGVENKLPGALQEHAGDGKIIPTEARRGLELVPLPVGPLKRHLVVGRLPAVALDLIGEHADRDAAQAVNLHGLDRWLGGLGLSHRNERKWVNGRAAVCRTTTIYALSRDAR